MIKPRNIPFTIKVILLAAWAATLSITVQAVTVRAENSLSGSPAVSQAIVVTDHLNRQVKLDAPAERIIALAPHIVENIYAAGAGHTLVGAVEYSDYPEAAKKLPRVGAVSTFNIESIIHLQPDLVVVWASGRGADVMNKLATLNIPTYASAPEKIQDVSKSIRDFGRLTGTQQIAEQAATAFDTGFARLAKQYQNKSILPAFFQVWHTPLQTLSGDHIISDAMRMCGGQNIFKDETVIAPKVSIESVLAHNPRLILTGDGGQTMPKSLDHWQRFAGLTAVKQQNLFYLPSDLILRHTPRFLQGVEHMCEKFEMARLKVIGPATNGDQTNSSSD